MIEGIIGAQQSFQVANTTKASKSTSSNFSDVNFKSALVDIARSVNITVANGASASQLELSRQKEQQDKPFSFEDAEEDLVSDYLGRIQKMMDELKK